MVVGQPPPTRPLLGLRGCGEHGHHPDVPTSEQTADIVQSVVEQDRSAFAMTGLKEALLPGEDQRLEAAAARLGLCGPACQLETLSDETDDWGERTVRVRCPGHGVKAATFRVRALGGMLSLRDFPFAPAPRATRPAPRP